MAPSRRSEDTPCRSIGSPAIFTDGAESLSSISSRSSPALSSSSTQRASDQTFYEPRPTMASRKVKANLDRRADNFDAMRFPSSSNVQPPSSSQAFSPISRHMLSYSKVPRIKDLQYLTSRGSHADDHEWAMLSNSEIAGLTKRDVISLSREVAAQNGKLWQAPRQHVITMMQDIHIQVKDHVVRLLQEAATQNDGTWHGLRPRIMILMEHVQPRFPDEVVCLLYETAAMSDALSHILTPQTIKLLQAIRNQVGEKPHIDLLRLHDVLELSGWSDAQVDWICNILWSARKHHQWTDEEVNEIARLLPNPQGRDMKSSRQINEIISVFRGEKDEPVMVNGKVMKNEYTIFELIDLLRGVGEFGIGNWTRILKDPRYTFICRTALDLKDRFRVSCPQFYPDRSKKIDGSPSESESGIEFKIRCHSNRGGKDVEYFTPQELQRYGVKVPFHKTDRRGRHDYTEQEDADILAGFHKHNGSWAAIKADPAYKLESRTPTDIRDRLRNEHKALYIGSGRCKLSAKVPDATRRPKRTAAAKTVTAKQEKKATKKPAVQKPRAPWAPLAPRAKKGSKAASKPATTSGIAEALSKMELSKSTTTDSSLPPIQEHDSSIDQHSEILHDSPLSNHMESPSIDYIVSHSPPAYASSNGPESRQPTATWGAVALAPSPQQYPLAPIPIPRAHNDPYNNIRLETISTSPQQQLTTPPNSLPSFATFMAPLVQRRSVTPTPHDDQMECDARPEPAAAAVNAAGHSNFVPETSRAAVAPAFREWLAKLN